MKKTGQPIPGVKGREAPEEPAHQQTEKKFKPIVKAVALTFLHPAFLSGLFIGFILANFILRPLIFL